MNKIKHPTIQYFQEINAWWKMVESLKVKGWEKIHVINTNQKKSSLFETGREEYRRYEYRKNIEEEKNQRRIYKIWKIYGAPRWLGWVSNSWFQLRSWSHGHGIQLCVGFHTERGACLRLSLPLALSPTCSLSLSPSLSRTKQHKTKQTKKKKKNMTNKPDIIGVYGTLYSTTFF